MLLHLIIIKFELWSYIAIQENIINDHPYLKTRYIIICNNRVSLIMTWCFIPDLCHRNGEQTNIVLYYKLQLKTKQGILFIWPALPSVKLCCLPITTKKPYANSLDPGEMPSNSASHPDPSCLTLKQHFHQLLVPLKHFENWSRQEI